MTANLFHNYDNLLQEYIIDNFNWLYIKFGTILEESLAFIKQLKSTF